MRLAYKMAVCLYQLARLGVYAVICQAQPSSAAMPASSPRHHAHKCLTLRYLQHHDPTSPPALYSAAALHSQRRAADVNATNL